MKSTTSRRLFLRKSAFATTGIALLSTPLLHAFSEESPFVGYNPYAESKTDLRTSLFGDKYVTVKGKILFKDGLQLASNAKVEVWHQSPNSDKYRHRAVLTTTDFGEYKFITDFPNNEEGKLAKIYFKVTAGNRTYFTELLLNSNFAYITSKHWEENNKLNDLLLPKRENVMNHSIIDFNISI